MAAVVRISRTCRRVAGIGEVSAPRCSSFRMPLHEELRQLCHEVVTPTNASPPCRGQGVVAFLQCLCALFQFWCAPHNKLLGTGRHMYSSWRSRVMAMSVKRQRYTAVRAYS